MGATPFFCAIVSGFIEADQLEKYDWRFWIVVLRGDYFAPILLLRSSMTQATVRSENQALGSSLRLRPKRFV
jgi:hypothetical protein